MSNPGGTFRCTGLKPASSSDYSNGQWTARPFDNLQKEARNAAQQEVNREAQQGREQAGARRKVWVAALRDLEAKIQQREVVIFMKMYVYQKLFNHKIQ